MKFSQYFDMLSDWKRLPAYKAEPRIDSLIGYYLPNILSAFFKTEIIAIIPELPIRLGTVKPVHEGTNYADRSFKVDFMAITNSDICYLVEFKTDSGSRRDKQDLYLQESKAAGVRGIMDGIVHIAQISSYKQKYNHLLNKLQKHCLLGDAANRKKFEVTYIQPSNKNNELNVIDFNWIAEWLSNCFYDEFEQEFAKTLRKWAKN